jgi:hypothetical protein
VRCGWKRQHHSSLQLIFITMKFSFVLAVLFAGYAAAASVPGCVKSCSDQAAKSAKCGSGYVLKCSTTAVQSSSSFRDLARARLASARAAPLPLRPRSVLQASVALRTRLLPFSLRRTSVVEVRTTLVLLFSWRWLFLNVELTYAPLAAISHIRPSSGSRFCISMT